MEQYTPIPNFMTYGITKTGIIIDYRTGLIKPSFPDERGYLRIQLKNPQGLSNKSVSRLVGETFIPNPSNLPQIDHINREKSDNRVENLRWCSVCENSVNRGNWGKFPKYISFDGGNSSKNPYTSYRIIIRNHKLSFSKRFKTSQFSLEEVVKIRNDILLENELPITD